MKSLTKMIGGLLLMFLHPVYALSVASDEGAETALVTARPVAIKGLATYPPLFARQARTLDPVDLARQSWKGYLSKQPEPWGTLPGGQAALRFHFDNRALPWPRLQHHAVDGYDNNNRNLGAHALLHAMLGAEKKDDPAEAGQIGYLLGCTDPGTGLPYSPDSLPRVCAVGHGELARNVMLLYEQTEQKELRDWAAKMIHTLRQYAVLTDRPGVGPVAAYCQGTFVVGEPPATQTQDPTLGGWQHLAVGWNLGAFSKWYELTGDRSSLEFAVALANRLCHSEDAHGNDGSLRPDGSFGGTDQASSASWHIHGHTHGLPGLMHLGSQLIRAGQREAGRRLITQACRTFDWLYDPARNPDAGSLTGWLPEWLMVATGWNRKGDCEGCTMGDVVQTAVALGAASRLDPSLTDLVNYYDRAEQIFTGQLVEQTFRLTPRYLAVLKECLQKRVDKEMAAASAEARAQEVERRYQEALTTAGRMVGQQLGLCGFPDWVNQLPSDLDPELPGIHMQGCCADATIRAAHAVWSETVTGEANETRVNLAFNRTSPLVQVISCLPHRGEVNVIVKAARKVLVRVPEWAPPEEVKAYREKKPIPVRWAGPYVVFDRVQAGQQLTVTYPLHLAEIREKINGVEYTERWRGNTIVDITPPGQWIPTFQRPDWETGRVPHDTLAKPRADEMAQAHRWVASRFGNARGLKGKDPGPPFSFVYGGEPSAELLPTWRRQRSVQRLDSRRTERTLTYTDPKTGLVVRGVAVEYRDFPTVEWTLYFKNTASADTPVLSDVQALDTRIERPGPGEFVLHHHTGGQAKPEDYQPLRTALGPNVDQRITTSGGRSSNSDFPYFNVEWPGEGVIMVIGWPGQWAAQFTRDAGAGLRVRAGQELTHFKLHPGEEVRTPLIVLQFWKGDRLRAQNTWRRWMFAHNLPQPGGKPLVPQLAACSSHQFGEMINANEENQILFIDRYLEEGLRIDYWWMDAGWYVNNGTWVNTGTWEVDRKRFPRGLRAITDHAHAKGVKSIVWFEPERVTAGTWLYENHPEWLLTPANLPPPLAYQADWRLLNLGDPEACQWLTDHVDHLITEQGIDLYRHDFNMDPLYFWRAQESEDRQGITEIRYVTGFLAYWDELRRRHSRMLIDNCASGGRRNDVETLRRAVPLTRSDYLFEPVGEQCHTYGIASWIPFYGTGTLVGPSQIVPWPSEQVDPYVFRSNMGPALTACWDVRREDLDYATLRRLTGQLRQVAPYYLGDYYPLTPYSTANDVWMAWQFDRSDLGEGVVQAFRRADSSDESVCFRLNGLIPDARYTVANLDVRGRTEITGRELMEKGLEVVLENQPGAALITYQVMRDEG